MAKVYGVSVAYGLPFPTPSDPETREKDEPVRHVIDDPETIEREQREKEVEKSRIRAGIPFGERQA